MIHQTQWLHTSNIVLFVTQFPEFLSANIPSFGLLLLLLLVVVVVIVLRLLPFKFHIKAVYCEDHKNAALAKFSVL